MPEKWRRVKLVVTNTMASATSHPPTSPKFAARGSAILDRVVMAVFLTVILSITLKQFFAPAVFFPWYFNTEEFPYVQEILRFTEFNFHQQFFDIPGTFLLLLGTALWRAYYLFSGILNHGAWAEGIRAFNFDHLQQLYIMMRCVSVMFFAASVVLTYKIGRRLTNAVGGIAAAALLAFHHAAATVLYHLRIEPMSAATVLFSVWLWLRARDSHSYRDFFLSGLVAGAALGVRYPSMVASISMLLLWSLSAPQDFRERRRLNLLLLAGMAVLAIAGGTLAASIRLLPRTRGAITDHLIMSSANENYAAAVRTTQTLWMAVGVLPILAALAFLTTKAGRKRGERWATSQLPVCLAGCSAGVLLAVPTMLLQSDYFLSSVEMFIERNRAGVAQAGSVLGTVKMYLFGWTPEPSSYTLAAGLCASPFLILLLAAGVAFAVYRWERRGDRLLLCMVAAAFFGLVAQHGKMQTIRHIGGWLPYFTIVMASPLAGIYQRLSQRAPWAPFKWLACIAVIGMSYTANAEGLRVWLTTRPPTSPTWEPNIDFFLEKNLLMPQLDKWLDENVDPSLQVFHVCCETADAEVVLWWMRYNGVQMPPRLEKKAFRRRIWFGDRQTIKDAKSGYIVISKLTYKRFYLDYYDKADPSKKVDPFTEKIFTLAAEIKGVTNTWLIYKFQF